MKPPGEKKENFHWIYSITIAWPTTNNNRRNFLNVSRAYTLKSDYIRYLF